MQGLIHVGYMLTIIALYCMNLYLNINISHSIGL